MHVSISGLLPSLRRSGWHVTTVDIAVIADSVALARTARQRLFTKSNGFWKRVACGADFCREDLKNKDMQSWLFFDDVLEVFPSDESNFRTLTSHCVQSIGLFPDNSRQAEKRT